MQNDEKIVDSDGKHQEWYDLQYLASALGEGNVGNHIVSMYLDSKHCGWQSNVTKNAHTASDRCEHNANTANGQYDFRMNLCECDQITVEYFPRRISNFCHTRNVPRPLNCPRANAT